MALGISKNAVHPQFPIIQCCQAAANYVNNLVVND